jgi:hypothetical protein
LYFQLVNQLNLEYTLSHIYGLKAQNEKEQIIKIIYQKLSDDSATHLALITSALRIVKKEIPKPRMVKVLGFDPSTMKKEEILIDEVDTDLEEIEAASAALFALVAEDFPDSRFAGFFWAMHRDEKLHQRLLKDIRAYKEMKK